MARETNARIEDYWAGQLAQSERFREMLGATRVGLIDGSLHDAPPVALFNVSYSSGASKMLWCEISGAWHSEAGEREICGVAEGKCPPPGELRRAIDDPNGRIADGVIQAVLKERGEDPYCELKRKYGPGHLHLFPSPELHRLFDESALSLISARLSEEDFEDQDVFRSISFGYEDQVYRLWSASDSPDPTP